MKAAIYCRLSEEDRNKLNANDDSNSIQNQKSMLIQYAQDQGWEIYDIYSDDDYTGSDRRRPQFNRLLEDAKANKAAALAAAVEAGVPVLAVDGGYELLGKTYETAEGQKLEGLGILDVQTKCGQKRLVGNCAYISEELDTTVVGFENHAGLTTLGSGVKPLGKVLSGGGNNGTDGTEGARYKNVFASYAHGSLLPKNPVLCDQILRLALERKYGEIDLVPLDDTLEQNAHDYMENRLLKK